MRPPTPPTTPPTIAPTWVVEWEEATGSAAEEVAAPAAVPLLLVMVVLLPPTIWVDVVGAVVLGGAVLLVAGEAVDAPVPPPPVAELPLDWPRETEEALEALLRDLYRQ